MLYVWDAPLARATKDLDFLGRMDNSLENMSRVVRELCSLAVDPDGMIFDPDAVQATRNTGRLGAYPRAVTECSRTRTTPRRRDSPCDRSRPRPGWRARAARTPPHLHCAGPTRVVASR
jgi:hypothetical protein